MVEARDNSRGLRKRRKGVVVSKSGDKSVVVKVDRRVRHPLYEKVMRRSKNFHAHDEANTAKVGDMVMISEARPISKLKRWRVLEILPTGRANAGADAQ
jgi:small subunit ribosomal protein S17